MRPAHVLLGVLLAAIVALTPATALAGPVAGEDGRYQLLGRVFPDPQGHCNSGPCSPQAKGNLPATSFIGYQELITGLTYMNDGESDNSKQWQRYMEVWTLDGDLDGNTKDDGSDDTDPGTDEKANFPGNNLRFWEFTPNGRAHSAGLPTSQLTRLRSDVFVVRVTDEHIPDEGKQRVALSLSIHGIERAGVEGGTRAMEDLVTAVTTGNLDKPILTTKGLKVPIPTYRQVLQHTIIYFTYPNPDGWRRGDLADQDKGPGVFYQRYNGNGVDENRDFPDIGYSFRPYSSLSEPETRAWSTAFKQIKANGGPFAAGDDLHGQLGADSFSFTLMPHGSHDFAKNERIRDAAKTINLVQQTALAWSPLIQPNDQPRGSCNNKPVVGADCYPMYGQSWGTVYDTINYTTTGALGDFMDSSIGLKADGIDNEMSYSHLDKDIAFEPLIEQMHVDGNIGLIYAHLAQILSDRTFVWPSRGAKGYVVNDRTKRGAGGAGVTAPPGTHPHADIDEDVLAPGGSVDQPIEVGGPDVYNGGFRVDVTTPNAQGINPGAQSGPHSLQLQCMGCDQHRGIQDEDEKDWITVAEDYNQSGIYLQAGLTVAINYPETAGPTGKPVEWRAKIATGIGPAVHVHVEFTQGPATSSGATGGDPAPQLAAYDVASTDFWKRLEPFTAKGAGFEPIDADKLAKDATYQVPDELDTLILSDKALPGYAFPALPPVSLPGDVKAASAHPTAPCGYTDGQAQIPTCYETFDFTVPKETGRAVVSITPTGDTGSDLTLTVYKKNPDGSTGDKDGTTSDGGGDGGTETVAMSYPTAGDYIAYVDNWAAPNSDWTGGVHFEPPSIGDQGASRYSDAEWNDYAAKLKTFVEGGGNLMLTDGALQALPYLFGQIKRTDVGRSISYVGQVAFTLKDTTSQDAPTEGNTLADPLAKNVNQAGARFNTGLRRQTYEPTPIGFSIQNAKDGGNEPHSPVWIVRREAFEAAGGRITATGTSGDADLARVVMVGELKLGKGVVRIAGALLPTPSEEFDHEQGLEPFAVTYTGYFLAENLTDWCKPGRSCPRIADQVSTNSTACVAARGFTSASSKPRKRGLRFDFKRAGTAPVRVDVFQVSKKRRVVHQFLVARFVKRKPFTWNGSRVRAKRPITDGWYFVRMSVKGPNGLYEGRRMALLRRHGRWIRKRSFYRRETCTRLRAFKLIRPDFGGSNRAGLGISFRLQSRERVRLVISRKGKTVKRYEWKRAKALTTYRRSVRAQGLRKGLYTVTITIGTGPTALRARLYSTRI